MNSLFIVKLQRQLIILTASSLLCSFYWATGWPDTQALINPPTTMTYFVPARKLHDAMVTFCSTAVCHFNLYCQRPGCAAFHIDCHNATINYIVHYRFSYQHATANKGVVGMHCLRKAKSFKRGLADAKSFILLCGSWVQSLDRPELLPGRFFIQATCISS